MTQQTRQTTSDAVTNLSTSNPPRRAPRPSASSAVPMYSTAQYTQNKRKAASLPQRQSFARQRQRRAASRRRRNEWAWVILAGAMISVFGILILGMFVLVRVPNATQVAVPTANLTPALPTPVDARSEFAADGRVVGVDVLRLNDGSLIDIMPWDGQSRYSIIVAGLDRRKDQSNEPVRTDSLMLVSINPKTDSIGVLSIPRDLWVEIPGQEDRDRINRAYFLGEVRGTGGGPRLLQQTISWNLGMRVHNYVLVDFKVLIDLVDLLGGIEVTIDYAINDERYPDDNYGYDPFYLAPGTHILDGADTLRFARTRHGNNDVLRAGRQQQVLNGIRDRALSINFLRLIAQVPALLGSFSENLQTGLSIEQIVQLALFAKDVQSDNIAMKVMNFDYLQEYTTDEYQQQVLIPIVERLPVLLSDTFGEDYAR